MLYKERVKPCIRTERDNKWQNLYNSIEEQN